MPKLLKLLQIDSVDSVDRGAGVGCEILLLKRQEERKMKTLDEMVDAEMHICKIGEPQAVAKVLGSIQGVQAYQRERDARLAKASDGKMHFASGGKPAQQDDDEISEGDTLEAMMREHMRQHPEVTHKSVAYDAVARTPKGRAILARDRAKAGISV